MSEIGELLKKYGITMLIAPTTLETNAWYVPDAKIIFVKGGLNDIERRDAILHEINGHVGHEHRISSLEAPTSRIHKEGEADRVMIHVLATNYIETLTSTPSFVDVNNFLSVNHLRSDLYDMACSEFDELLHAK